MTHISFSMNFRDMPELQKLIADLRQLQRDIEAGGAMPSDIGERLDKLIEPFEDDREFDSPDER
jgi:hypothetical protein